MRALRWVQTNGVAKRGNSSNASNTAPSALADANGCASACERASMRAPGPTTVRMRPRISGAPQQSPKPPCLLQYVETELKVAQLHVAARETDWTFAHRPQRDCLAYPPHKDSRSIVISLRNFPRKCLINPWIVFSNIGRHVRSFGGRKRFRTALDVLSMRSRHGTGPFSKIIIILNTF